MRLSAYIKETDTASEIITYGVVDDHYYMWIHETVVDDDDQFTTSERYDITVDEYHDYSRQSAHTSSPLESGEPVTYY